MMALKQRFQNYVLDVAERVAPNRLDRELGRALKYGFIRRASMPGSGRFHLPSTTNTIDLKNMWRGTYEGEEISILRKHFCKAATIIEIGANIGVVSRIAYEEKLQKGGRMICVEPNPDTFRFLEKNVIRHGDKQLAFYQSAISTGNGATADFVVKANLSSGLAGHLKQIDDGKIVRVNVLPFTQIAAEAAGHYSLICDAEGAEIFMFQNEKAAFELCDQIMIELHEPSLTGLKETPDDMIAEIESLGFYLKAREGNSCYFSREP